MHPSSPRTVLVLGAGGRLGAAAVTAFRAAGWRVVAQVRRIDDHAGPEPGPGRIDIPLQHTQQLALAAQGASAVVYAVNMPYSQWAGQMLPLARAGMAVAEQLGATFMLPGNVYAYGERMPALLREETPESPTTRYGELRQQLEAELQARAANSGVRSVVIRAGDFFGAAKNTWIDLHVAKHLADPNRLNKRLSYPGPLDVPHAWAYLPDLARAFVAAAERGGLPAHTRLHFEGHTLTGQQLLDGLELAGRDLGLVAPGERVVHQQMNWTPIRIAGLFVPMLRGLAQMRYLYRVPHALDGRALTALLGPLPQTSLREALRATLAAMGQRAAGLPAAAVGERA